MKKLQIDPRERLALILLSGILSLIVLVPISAGFVDDYNNSVRNHQEELNCLSNPRECVKVSAVYQAKSIPLFHLLTPFIFVAIVKAKRFIVSFLLTLTYVGFFVYATYVQYSYGCFLGEDICPPISFGGRLARVGDPFNIFTGTVILILLFWLASILLRGNSSSRRRLA